MTASAQDEYWVSARGLLLLWAAVLLGPIAWILQHEILYVLAPTTCGESPAVLHLASVATLVLAAVGGWLGWRAWAMTGSGSQEAGGRVGRSRFMAVTGLFMSGLFALAIIAQWIPVFIVDPCQ